jgi:hypothetical protein
MMDFIYSVRICSDITFHTSQEVFEGTAVLQTLQMGSCPFYFAGATATLLKLIMFALFVLAVIVLRSTC